MTTLRVGQHPGVVHHPRVLPAAVRVWAALAGLGFGLIALGVGSGHVGPHPVVGAVDVGIGLAATAWALAALRGPRALGSRPAVALAVAAPVILLSAPIAGVLPTAAEASALALGTFSAVLAALAIRLGPEPADPPAGRQAAALAVGALLVATLTVPGLAATNAGEHAVPHGSHGLPAEQHHH